MEHIVLNAKKRDAIGSRHSARLRREGRIPAVLYGTAGKTVAIDLDSREFSKSIKGISESTLINISIDGVNHEVFIKDIQRNILNGALLHADFYEVEKGKMLRAKVPLHIVGSAIGVREGGVLETPMHEIEVECLPGDLPERITIDISDLKANQSIHVRDITLPNGVKILSNAEQVVALVKYAKAEVPAAEEVAAQPAEEGAAAPGEAAETETETPKDQTKA